MFTVGEPLFEDLVSAELVAPDACGDVAPKSAVVQVDIEGGVAEGGESVSESSAFVRREVSFNGAALTGHYGAS